MLSQEDLLLIADLLLTCLKWKKTSVLTINVENLDQPLKWSKEL